MSLPDNPHGGELTIDLGAIAENWATLAARVPAAACGAVVKADAYGCGIAQVVPALFEAGCRTFFVAHLGEAGHVRAAAPEAVIYVLNGLPPASAPAYTTVGARPVLGSAEEVAEWRATGGASAVGLHVDTGMQRLGLAPRDAVELSERGSLQGLPIALVMSHYTSSEVPADPANAAQTDTFKTVIVPMFQRYHPAFSLLNSSGHFLPGVPAFDLTRPGYALYGGNPTPFAANPMREAVRLVARVLQVRTVPAGAPVGYNGAWIAPETRVLATLSLGYADGYPRRGGGTAARGPGGMVMIADHPCPIVGTISMDLMIVDVTAVAEQCRRGSPVVLIGDGLSLESVGAGARTIGYEILTSLGRRHRRLYRRGG